MAIPLEIEQIIQSEIRPLSEQFTNTRELYREVCVLLFFRHGITPTANLLYQLVRRGSMSTPAQAVQAFWTTLREKSRHRVSHPDLPSELQDVTGTLVASVWEKANELAAQNYAVFKDEALQTLNEVNRQVEAVTHEREATREQLDAAEQVLSEREAALAEAAKALSASQATIASLERQLLEQASSIRAANSDLESARKDFAAELDKMRSDLALAEDRLNRDHARMLIEIDNERQVTAALRDELEAARTHNRKSDESWRTALEKAHRAVGDLREKSGTLEGKLHAAENSLARAESELDAHRKENMALKLGSMSTAISPKAAAANEVTAPASRTTPTPRRKKAAEGK